MAGSGYAVIWTCIIVLTAILLKFLFSIRSAMSALKAQFPSPPGSLVVGHATSDLFGSPQAFLKFTETLKKYGKTVAVRLVNKPVVLTCDPFLIAAMFDRSLDGTVLDKPQLYKMENLVNPDPSKSSILTYESYHTAWKLLRKGISPAFNPANLRKEFPATVASALELVKSIKASQGEEVNVDEAAQRQAMDVIGRVGFGVQFGATKDLTGNPGQLQDDPLECLDWALAEAYKRMIFPLRQFERFFWFKDAITAYQKAVTYRGMIRNMVQETRKKQKKGEVAEHTVVGHLLRVPDYQDASKPLSDADLGAQFAVFFFAGTDTTGHTVAWTLYHLIQNPEVLGKVEKELDDLGLLVTAERPSPRPLEYTDLSKLIYLGWVFKESMRMTPVVGGVLAREALVDLTLNGHFIPKGTMLCPAIHATHHHPDNWDRPEEFLPERWEGEGVEYLPEPSAAKAGSPSEEHKHADQDALEREAGFKSRNKPLRYLPFGAGPRQCIGMALAKMNGIATLALLISNFNFRLAEKMGGPEGVNKATVERISVCPKGGMWLHCIPRA
eukprot:jgi/Botrbrau1/2622/Bobra.145_1s0040.1